MRVKLQALWSIQLSLGKEQYIVLNLANNNSGYLRKNLMGDLKTKTSNA